jgi:hypothetical protein
MNNRRCDLRDWLTRNSEPLQALGAIATAFAAISALIIIPYQVTQADRIQRDQTAREIYREFLNLTVQKPELANADYCALKGTKEQTAYAAYVEYLLYTSEQMIDTSPDWRAPMAAYLGDHMTYLCSQDVWDVQGDVQALVANLGLVCKPEDQCG